VRWLQDVRRYQPSTVSRRLSVVVGFYRVCVIDAVLEHSPADYVRRPAVPAESPTLGLGHRRGQRRADPAQHPRRQDGSARRDPPAEAPRQQRLSLPAGASAVLLPSAERGVVALKELRDGFS
jgi:hypothetical protein